LHRTNHAILKDSYRHKGLRRKLVEAVRAKGITDAEVLRAIGDLPRHLFLDKAFEEWAYEDKPFPIGSEQTISQPYTVAYQTVLLQPQKRHKILEVGTGSGYQAAILTLLGARVYSVERQEALHKRAGAALSALGFSGIRLFFGDGYKGLPQHAPFDGILVTAGAPEVPSALLEQLKTGGRLVIPVGDRVQGMYRYTRLGIKEFQIEKFDDFRFVPLLKGIATTAS
jgi:protein-L-isoaspartate(D-aspartate) O-methyltransferase